ncbi:MAG TPA: hypothetical protein VD905_18960 [Flavobacteriales bacterium]|nr:hypothetical protein [Flavobacteriales bacterium]
MKKLILIFTGFLTIGIANAQFSAQFQAKSGDTELDASLSNINAQAKLDLTLFKKDMSVSFGITSGKLDKLLLTMQPADVYMSLEIGKIVSKPVDIVVASYEKNKSKGWGVIAKEMGIKPGSKEFHALKGKAKDKGNKDGKKDKADKSSASNGKGNGNGNGKGKKK